MTRVIHFLFLFLLFSSTVFSQKTDLINKELNALKFIINPFRELIKQSENAFLLKKLPEYEGNTDNFKIEFTTLDSGKDNVFKGTIAIAIGSGDDTQIHILIDTENWLKLNVVEKFSTLMHEISHDAFNFKHTDFDELSLMHPSAQPNSISELTMMVIRMLDNYKYGLIEEFQYDDLYIHNEAESSKTKLFKKSKNVDLIFDKRNEL